MEIGGHFVRAQGDVVVESGAGAMANPVCCKWLANHNSYFQKMGTPNANPYPAMAHFKFEDGRVGVERYAADINVGVAGRLGRLDSVCSGC